MPLPDQRTSLRVGSVGWWGDFGDFRLLSLAFPHPPSYPSPSLDDTDVYRCDTAIPGNYTAGPNHDIIVLDIQLHVLLLYNWLCESFGVVEVNRVRLSSTKRLSSIRIDRGLERLSCLGAKLTVNVYSWKYVPRGVSKD